MQIHYGIESSFPVCPVVTMGSFDGVHKGHVLVIEALKRVARQLGGETVLLTFEPHPREVLYPMEKRPGILTTLEEKIERLAFCGVEHLIVQPFTLGLAGMDYREFVREFLVEKIGVRGLVVGYDHRFGRDREGTFAKLKVLSEKYHFYLEQEDAYEEHQIHVSSTKIRNALLIGDIGRVNEFLGYDYTLAGKAVAGDRMGRSIGFPTANIGLGDERKLLPASGVYAVRVSVDGKGYGGMLNIGVRPTVSRSGVTRIEVNIFDFDRDIYGHDIRVSLLERIRGERKFSDAEELRRQLFVDRQTVLARLDRVGR